MALEKQICIDKIEILEDGTIQIREATKIFEDGKLLSKANTNRRILFPDQDITKENAEIQAIAGIIRTSDRVKQYEDKKAIQIKKTEGADL